MYFRLTFEPQKGCVDLPLSYHHILQGFVYHLLDENPEYASFLHDTGFQAEARIFKMFVCGLLNGRYRVSDGQIRFLDTVSFEIRSPMAEFNGLLSKRFSEENVYQLGNNTIILSGLEIGDKEYLGNRIYVSMRSPLVLKKYMDVDGKSNTRYLTPQDDDFNELLNDNYRRKYLAAFGQEPTGKIWIDPNSWHRQKKYVTRFPGKTGEDILITGWLGDFELKADPHALSFLYDVGLGSNNSAGFGMFD